MKRSETSAGAAGFEATGEAGATTIEYTMVVAFVSSISIFATIWLINVLLDVVARLVIRMAVLLN